MTHLLMFKMVSTPRLRGVSDHTQVCSAPSPLCGWRPKQRRRRFPMLIRDVMTARPACCKPVDTIDKVARLMLDHDCGEIPVCDGDDLVGVITDRDLALRAVAAGR